MHNRDNPKKLPTVKKIDDVTTTWLFVRWAV